MDLKTRDLPGTTALFAATLGRHLTVDEEDPLRPTKITTGDGHRVGGANDLANPSTRRTPRPTLPLPGGRRRRRPHRHRRLPAAAVPVQRMALPARRPAPHALVHADFAEGDAPRREVVVGVDDVQAVAARAHAQNVGRAAAESPAGSRGRRAEPVPLRG
ncbi:hypothetical protein [Streptomyces caniscabiei]|uniref:hypothetical protein n=1 Tax=Streptomyces caniscabiei TaxID=2746961 RepID=UPI00117E8E95|nr:hypothetical protein [Streptomyces caniscabiei]